MEQSSTSLPSQGCVGQLKEFAHPNHVPGDVLGYRSHCYPPCPYINWVRAVSIFLAGGQNVFNRCWVPQGLSLSLIPFVIFMDWISRHNQVKNYFSALCRRGSFGFMRLWLQACSEVVCSQFEVVGMRITSKSEAKALCWKTVDCSVWVWERVAGPSEGGQVSQGLVGEWG